MKMFATIALAAIASVAAQNSNSNSSECTAESLTSARNACDSVADVSQLKCDNEACHEALHSLVEDEVRQCYVDLGLGPVTDLDYYTLLDEFCHGDGADPADLAAAGSTAGNSTSSGTGGTTVGDDHDHDHVHDHSHDHDHDESASASASASGSSSGNVAQALVALQLLAAAAVTLLV